MAIDNVALDLSDTDLVEAVADAIFHAIAQNAENDTAEEESSLLYSEYIYQKKRTNLSCLSDKEKVYNLLLYAELHIGNNYHSQDDFMVCTYGRFKNLIGSEMTKTVTTVMVHTVHRESIEVSVTDEKCRQEHYVRRL